MQSSTVMYIDFMLFFFNNSGIDQEGLISSLCKEIFARIKGQYSRKERVLHLDSEILTMNSTTRET